MAKRLIKVKPADLKRYAEGNYVDTPLYHIGSWPVRWIQWAKLGKVLEMVTPGGSALDFGCGNGVLLPSLSRIFGTIVALDPFSLAAQNLVNDQNLKNVLISTGTPKELGLYNAIFAASSLEHVINHYEILNALHANLDDKGHLYCIIPTENWVYRLGRWILGYKKPKDHYHSLKEIKALLYERFKPVREINYLGLYYIAKYEKA